MSPLNWPWASQASARGRCHRCVGAATGGKPATAIGASPLRGRREGGQGWRREDASRCGGESLGTRCRSFLACVDSHDPSDNSCFLGLLQTNSRSRLRTVQWNSAVPNNRANTGTDMLSSRIPVTGSDSTAVQIAEINARRPNAPPASTSMYPQ